MPLSKFLGIILGCYVVYYFFAILMDLLKSKSPAIAADHKNLHAVQYELTEQPHAKSERVSKDTHLGGNTSSAGLTSESSSLNQNSQNIQEDSEQGKTVEEATKDELSNSVLPGQYDLEEERKTLKSTFNLEHEEMSKGIEVYEENFSQLLSFV